MAVGFGGGALLLAPILAVATQPGWPSRAASRSPSTWASSRRPWPTSLFARGLAHLPAASVATLTLAEPLTAATLGVVDPRRAPRPGRGARRLLVLSGLLVLAGRPRGRRLASRATR